MEKLECYAVFEGGGIKGIAFAGALEAADQAGIEFVGYAGASAGALVGFLACLNYSGKNIFNVIRSIDFIKFTQGDIEESVSHIKRVILDIKSVESVNKKRGFFTKVSYWLKIKSRIPLFAVGKDLSVVYKKLNKDKGLYSKEKLINLLVSLAQSKINLSTHTCPDGKNYRSVSFSDFYKFTGKDFRVIATDVLTGRVVEFSHLKTPDACVIQVVAASCAYPIIFEPTEYNGMYLVDGGLSCNLPSYIFHDSHHKRLPTYAFDLMGDKDLHNSLSNYKIFDHLKRLVYSSLDASNNIISRVSGGIAVPLKVPSHIDAMNMNISPQDSIDLFNAGFISSSTFFANHDLTYLYTRARSKHQIASLLYGRLEGLQNLLINFLPKPAVTLKMWLFTTIDSFDNELVSFSTSGVVYLNVINITTTSYNIKMQRIPFKFSYPIIEEKIIKLLVDGNINRDVIAQAWNSGVPAISFNARRTTICFPITRFDSKQVLAVQCIEIDQAGPLCPWIKITNHNSTNKVDISNDFGIVLYDYGLLVRSAMYGHQVFFHQSNQ